MADNHVVTFYSIEKTFKMPGESMEKALQEMERQVKEQGIDHEQWTLADTHEVSCDGCKFEGDILLF